MTWTADPRVLQPLREALLEKARREAQAVIDAATSHADDVVTAAARAAADQVATARAQGVADALRAATVEETAAQSQARTIVLAARDALDEELRGQVLARVRALRQDAGYDKLRTALRQHGAALLGDGVTYREPAGGGVVVEASGRRLDASLDALAKWASAVECDALAEATA